MADTEHLDVLIVGAGLSGVGAACRLRTECPQRSFAIVEARDAVGGTWDLFRYPGIRSDSDMFTLGYPFRGWSGKAIADGPSILSYIRETAREYGLDRSIRLNRRVVSASWSSGEARWTVTVERTDSGDHEVLTCGFLLGCTGYYRYDRGYSPGFEGEDDFPGPIVHPQQWPEELELSGRRVAVIGSGATAATLVPAIAPEAAHVTMIQRSPGYVIAMPSRDPVADLLGRLLPARLATPLVRWKNVLLTLGFYRASRRAPRLISTLIRRGVARRLPAGYPVEPDFTPRYDPWDQRVCLVPDGDLFEAIGSGRASVVTDRIERFTERGVELASGREVAADVIVTATGLTLLILGGIEVDVDGERVDPAERFLYKGTMLTGVPNLAVFLGYTNASWTLKADLAARWVCRLLNHMEACAVDECRPKPPPPDDPGEPALELTSGYVMRSIEELPRQGSRPPWRLHQNYPRDLLMLNRGPLDDGTLDLRRRALPNRSAVVLLPGRA
jgi:monooxygenase